jgi:signal transduction histidine kinase
VPGQGQAGVAQPESQTEVRHKLRVLLVEDDPADVELALRALSKGGFETEREAVQTAEEFKQKISKGSYDVILADYRLPGWCGIETVQMLRQEGLDIPVILVSGSLGEVKAVECIKQGAADYVLKDHLPRLPESVRHAIREKKLREANLQAQAELARSNRDLEQFAYVASHDLQEPLRMVAAYTQLLAERYQGKLDATADKYIHYAVDGALRMQALVQDLLTFSRVGRGGVDAKPVEAGAAVAAAVTNLKGAVGESDARVDYHNLPSVLGDRSQLTQLFQNLIGNAIKFRGGESPNISITAEGQRGQWLFAVSDNGIGIAPEHAEAVFAIFKRLHTREEYPGSGIGLAICKRIVEQSGGRIWVESQMGRGSTFKFTLPAVKRGAYDHAAEN